MAITFALTTSAYEGAQAGMAASIPFPDITVTSNIFSIPSITGTITSYVYKGSSYPQNSYQNSAYFYATIAINGVNTSEYVSYSKGYLYIGATSGWSSKSWTATSDSVPRLYTQNYFNASNKTSRTVPITLINSEWGLSNDWYAFSRSGSTASGSATLTLDVPPTFNEDYPTISKNTDDYYKDVTTVTVNSRATAYYGGNIASTTLTIGNQTQTITGNGSVSIRLNAIGTFTPVVTVVDSRGQLVSTQLPDITVIEGTDSTYSYNITSSTRSDQNDYYYADKSSANVVVNTSVPYGGHIETLTFNIGSTSETYHYSEGDSSQINLTIPLTAIGNQSLLLQFTDSFGRNYVKNLNRSISVLKYEPPSINPNVYRVTSTGELSDVGTYGVIEISVTYTSTISKLLKPIIKINNISETTSINSFNVTWYANWDPLNTPTLSSAIDWTNYQPNSPCVIYGLVQSNNPNSRSVFTTSETYNISIIVKDNYNERSTEITQRLSQAFYTIDVFAGGHGLAFGKMASKEGFECAMDTNFEKKVTIDINDSAASGTDFKILQLLDLLAWSEDCLEEEDE